MIPLSSAPSGRFKHLWDARTLGRRLPVPWTRPSRKREFKKALHRRNRRKARQNPESHDKPLDARAYD